MIIVTGGTGFIGSNIANYFSENKEEVVICDNIMKNKKKNIYLFDINNLVEPKNIFKFINDNKNKISSIVHMGAISSTTEKNIDLLLKNNFYLSWELWKWCSKYKKKFIYSSSASTYGNGDYGFSDEDDYNKICKYLPLNHYAWSKQLFDKRVLKTIQEGGPEPTKWVGLKFFNVYGPNEYHKKSQSSVALQMYQLLKERNIIKLFKSHNKDYQDGFQLRDFVYVKDCVKIISWLLKNEYKSGIYNIGTGKARSFLDLAKSVSDAMGAKPVIEWIDTPLSLRHQYQYFTEAKMEKIKKAGYLEEATSLEDGVKDYVESYLHI
ncbi:ADP-glyceromanno-heptose 6-epimerase [Alphaproteobacteria bacterium]|nr:ADP-glyceromanno-heptose 6-epimerase [Alphaproteobacteria bacterium]